MKVYFDLSKKALKSVDLENQTIYTGDLVSTLEVISNQVATNEYVLLSAKLPNAREVGPYLFDGLRADDTTNNTSTWTFTLSKANGFTLVAGNTTFYLWLIKGTEKKCIGAVNVNVEHATAVGDYSYFVDVDDSDVDDTLTNMAAQIDQCMDAVALANTAISTLGTTKVDKQTANSKGKVTNTNSATEIERTENNYKSAISFLGDVLKSIVKNPSDASAPNTEIKQEDDQIEIKVVDSNYNNTFTLLLDATSFYVFDNRFSELYPVFQVSTAGIYYMREHLLTSVNTANIVDRAVTGIKLALNSVGTTHIVDGAITNDKLADDAVDTDNVKDKAITRAKLSQELQDFLNDIVASIPDGSVTTPKIVNGAVTKEKLATALATQIDGAGRKLALEIDTDFKIVAKLYDKDDNLISTSNAIDLPLESVVVSGAYDSQTQKVVLTLQDGSTIEFSVADLVSGLQPEITSSNKLAVNLVAFSQAQLDALNSGITAAKVSGYDSHLSNTNNPHSVTKAQVGLGNVDNTSDANKPVSTAQQAALNLKEDKANKVNSISSASTDDKYPSAKAVYDGIQNYGGAVGVNKALYHLGAYDSADGKIRQTGYAVLTADKILNISTSSHVTQSILVNFAVYTTNKPSSNDDIKNFTNSRGFASRSANDMWNNNVTGICEQMDDGKFTVRIKDVNDLATFVSYLPIYIEYQLATSYQDTPIENQSILPLDTNMANKIRQRVVDGLNLISALYQGNGTPDPSMTIRVTAEAELKANQTYHLSLNSSATNTAVYIYYSGTLVKQAGTGNLDFSFTTPYTGNHKIIFMAGGGDGTILVSNISNLMLVEGNHTYPHSDFNQKEHITNAQAELLKSEWEKSSQLFDLSKYTFSLVSSAYQTDQTIYLKAGNYVESQILAHDFNLVTSDGAFNIIDGGSSTSHRFVITTSGNFKIRFTKYNSSMSFADLKIMLNEGSQALPYHEYCGEILHEVDRPKLYRHFVKLYFGDSEYGFTGEVICDNPNALTFDDLKALYPTETKQLKLYPSDPSVDDAIGNTPSTGGADGAMIVSAYFNLYTENKVFACVVYVSNGKLVGEERVFYPSTQHGVDVRVAITDNVEDM